MIGNTGMENFIGQMEIVIKGNGKMVKNVGKENISSKMESIKVLEWKIIS